MKFTAILAFIAAATVVSASTNAERLARGLPPNAPMKRASPVERARRSYPSSQPHKCNGGSVHCCKNVEKAGHGGKIDDLLNLANIAIVVDELVGSNCSPISVIGVGSGSKCTQQTVCCSNVHQNGLISTGCTPINISG
ncbi:hydrophobin [Boletus reticuloceps]|uniref:Hydrophobin n=1 Tax=Boletus reticuloceps TaxID=495285 RepID=A0A8I2YXF6_9AGAM|nr:hydrophobin [Boletus reticuloceps]